MNGSGSRRCAKPLGRCRQAARVRRKSRENEKVTATVIINKRNRNVMEQDNNLNSVEKKEQTSAQTEDICDAVSERENQKLKQSTVKWKFFIILFLVSSNVLLFGQQIAGIIFEKNSETHVEYVNIGIVGKNIGTVSDQNGKYTLQIDLECYNDTLRFSCIGYHSYSVKVSDFINLNNGNVSLEKRLYELTEVVIRPKNVKQKTLGITTRGMTSACFVDSVNGVKGAEIGVLMTNKKKAFIKEININISRFSYDTIFYRINIHKSLGKKQFENILSNPIYVVSSKEEVKNKITIDLRPLNLVVEGDFLVTFESVKDLGPGMFCFYASLFNKSYFRAASQGTWKTISSGISISVEVEIEN